MYTWGLTDTGMVRQQNQDAYYHKVEDKTALAVVCDGMGGARAGNVASRMGIETFVEKLDLTAKDVDSALLSALDAANAQVMDYAMENTECFGMGTTLVAALVRGMEAAILNVGDSRCYYIADAGIWQITRDHSLVSDLVDRGELTPEEAREHPRRNLITRALGAEREIRGDLFHQTLVPGSVLLLCSDGLSNVVTDQELLYEVIHGGDIDSCCKRLIDIAISRGAPDNVTVVLLLADEAPED